MSGLLFRRHTAYAAAIALSAALLCSCGADTAGSEASSQSFVFDTYAQMSVHGGEAKQTLSEVEQLFAAMSEAFDLC
ncbi:MAG: hypothetical protein K2J72_03220, partial [Oscillospiraceae bacterium]|nr:hypothetical protein [Oscillospiraceae bacterium]